MKRKNLKTYIKERAGNRKTKRIYKDNDENSSNDGYVSPMSEDEQIRVRMLKVKVGNSKVKTVERFTVGYEINIGDKWYIVLRYCNFHVLDKSEFHKHVPIKVLPKRKSKRVKIKNRKKTPTSQLNWALKNLKSNHIIYRRDFLEKFFNNNE